MTNTSIGNWRLEINQQYAVQIVQYPHYISSFSGRLLRQLNLRNYLDGVNIFLKAFEEYLKRIKTISIYVSECEILSPFDRLFLPQTLRVNITQIYNTAEGEVMAM